MPISIAFRFLRRPTFPHRLCFRQVYSSCAAATEAFHQTDATELVEGVAGNIKEPKWRKLNANDLGLTNSKIPRPTRVVLNGLKKKGHDVYLVGGCVRDLILERTPKDFDIITSAQLFEVMDTFYPACEMVGRQFPICHVYVDNTFVEVSSFSTSFARTKRDLSSKFKVPDSCDDKDLERGRNCLRRDFTINGLMFDPYAKLVYDYFGGLEDIKKDKVRTIVAARCSLMEDSARILRAIRIAARLGFRFARETSLSIIKLSYTVLWLGKAPDGNELHARIRRCRSLTEVVMEIWPLRSAFTISAYLVQTGFKRHDERSNMLLSLFSNLDKLLGPDRPCHSSLWVAILALHKALSDKPRNPLVVAAFSLTVYNGGDLSEAVDISRKIAETHVISFPELSESQHLDHTALKDEAIQLAYSFQEALKHMTNESFISKAMESYPQAPHSSLVFIPFELYLRVGRIFECVTRGKEKDFVPKQGNKIEYDLLALGKLSEVRHVFARVVLDTIYPIKSS